MKLFSLFSLLMVAVCFLSLALAASQAAELGAFSDHRDVGNVGKPGTAEFDPANGTYLVGGGGENMWFTNDAFHFVWKKMAGDLKLAADIRWPAAGGNAHRKACLIIRQDLDPDSPYADAALHGDGLTSLQYRETAGASTREIQSNVSGPARLAIHRRGDYVWLSVGAAGGKLQPAGGSFRIRFHDPVYVGLGVCAHDNRALEQAAFSNVEIKSLPPAPTTAPLQVESTLEIVPISSMDRRVAYHTGDHIEAPNWSPDGSYLVFNSQGRLYTLPVAGGLPRLLNTGFAVRCNNDHGISPDGKLLAISDQSQADNRSRIYVLPISGGEPRLVTTNAPSYWHGWSPDGRTLAYCAERKGEFDVYTIPVGGGDEKRLTTAPGLDDGPEYSPDGRFIYFNSERTGRMQIWRMKPDGSDQEQVTQDEFNNWFAHPSPDGRWIVFLSYAGDVKGHPANQDVMLRLMPAGGGPIRVLAKLFGGQGTINVPSWSPDSQRVAFVSYLPVYP
jgi:TolB protein